MPGLLPASVPLAHDEVCTGMRAAKRILPPIMSAIGLWSARSRQRRRLGELARFDSHLLDDIGLSPDEALREAKKWFWQK